MAKLIIPFAIVGLLFLTACIILPYTITQHNWPVVEIASLFSAIIFLASTSIAIIISLISFKKATRTQKLLPWVPLAVVATGFLYNQVTTSQIDVNIIYNGPLDSTPIEYATKFGSTGTTISKGSNILVEDVGKMENFFVSIDRYPNKIKLIKQNSELANEVPFIGRHMLFTITITGNKYTYDVNL